MLGVTVLIGLRASVVQQIGRAWLTPPGAKPPTTARPRLRPGSGNCPQGAGQAGSAASGPESSHPLPRQLLQHIGQGSHPPCSQRTPRAAPGWRGLGEGQAEAVLGREGAGAPLAWGTLCCETK